MRSSSYRIVAPLFVLLVLSTVQGRAKLSWSSSFLRIKPRNIDHFLHPLVNSGIKLERSNYISLNRRLHQSLDVKANPMTRGSGAALVPCKGSRSRHCSSGSAGVDQRIPGIYEDYYGPGDHKSTHH